MASAGPESNRSGFARAVRLQAAAFTAGIVAGLLASAIAAGARSVLDIDPAFAPLDFGRALALSTVAAMSGASAVWYLAAWARRPRVAWRRTWMAGLTLSLVPDVALLVAGPGRVPGVSVTAVLVLALLHLVVAAVEVPVLTRFLPPG